ncbi:hypothetical protein [Paraburkholderia dinghuensis]|uniref:Uncharacterized protein n=1 Tax=Paraburkholderia dinghuensis TaxID=2305225 RepID=A0A3N6NEI8_9BURK|nr:hypothetical protein [Paraburkholderia dinghuensis]RQH06977.1 hypothetical protein D1Y85_09860 [Paraburkholderia dinghuensis]
MCILTVNSNQQNNVFSNSTTQNGAGHGSQGRGNRDGSQAFTASQSSFLQSMNQGQYGAGTGAYWSSTQVSQQSFTASQSGMLQSSSTGRGGAGNGAGGNSSQGSDPQSNSTSFFGKLKNAIGYAAEGLHWGAENLISASGLGPIFQTFDKPVIHNLLWSPIARLTGVPVDSHPPGIA